MIKTSFAFDIHIHPIWNHWRKSKINTCSNSHFVCIKLFPYSKQSRIITNKVCIFYFFPLNWIPIYWACYFRFQNTKVCVINYFTAIISSDWWRKIISFVKFYLQFKPITRFCTVKSIEWKTHLIVFKWNIWCWNRFFFIAWNKLNRINSFIQIKITCKFLVNFTACCFFKFCNKLLVFFTCSLPIYKNNLVFIDNIFNSFIFN